MFFRFEVFLNYIYELRMIFFVETLPNAKKPTFIARQDTDIFSVKFCDLLKAAWTNERGLYAYKGQMFTLLPNSATLEG